ncbi:MULTISPECIES: hypothetical protein [unclassified Phenylobacterium]|uniref:hypothetical protein n=1 Tax=unclassified Phenylobacterium TaxID=2640670 RepID=UPI00083AA13A|nr:MULTISPECIES: hypothetical protein [unclassified Phenylobacterium]
MPTLDPNSATSSGVLPNTGVVPLPADALPAPVPGQIEPVPGDSGRLRIVTGTDADDVLTLDGLFAFGGKGADTFVLTSVGADDDGPENLGTVMDLSAEDKIDLSQLGPNAAILGREADGKGGERISIDFDGDGDEDGFVTAFENGAPAPDDAGVVPGDDGEFHILPFPMPGDGEFHILPYPMPGDGEVGVYSAVEVSTDTFVALTGMTLDWIA